MRTVAALVTMLCSCASSGGDGKAATDDPRDYVGKDALVDYATLKFLDADEKARFDAARKCFGERASGWEHYPLRKIGNFVEENWCTGEGARNGCSGGGFRDRPGAQWAEVGTLHYPDGWPEVFGVQIGAGHNHEGDGWSVSVSGSTNGKSILGDGGSIAFERGGQRFYVGDRYGWEIEKSRFDINANVDAWTLIDRVRQSPQALREEALSHWTQLEAEVLAALDKNEVRKCVYGEYEGNGIPPECIEKVPLSPQEADKERARISEHVAWIRSSLDNDAKGLHAALIELAPLDCF